MIARTAAHLSSDCFIGRRREGTHVLCPLKRKDRQEPKQTDFRVRTEAVLSIIHMSAHLSVARGAKNNAH